MPIYALSLDEVVKQRYGKNLFFAKDVQIAIKEADITYASVNTPTEIKGVRGGVQRTCASTRAWDARWQSMPIAQRLA